MLNFAFSFYLLILILTYWICSVLVKLIRSQRISLVDPEDVLDELLAFKNFTVFLIPASVFGYGIWMLVSEMGWQAHVLDWVHLLIRWFHVVIGIAWIGASFYFIFLENSLNRTENLRDEIAGNLWAVHGGGFYYLEKYKTAPKKLPDTLHWFKYEAYFTWVSGMFLLMMVYYLNAEGFMVDPNVARISSSTAIFIGLGTLVSGWLIYDFMCKSSLLAKKKLFALIGFGILSAISFFLSQFLSGRAAFMHVGALLGTIMVGNVFFVIIPAQKALVKAAKQGKLVDPEIGKYAGLRSLHNNYTTLPVIFVMISNHFPSTYGNEVNWLVLAILIIGSVAVRHYINMHEKGQNLVWLLPVGAIAIFAAVIITAPKSIVGSDKKVVYGDVKPIFAQRCVSCHSANPTDDITKAAPAGAMFETYEQCSNLKEKILNRAVQTKTMPQGNKTKITEEERELIGQWIAQGAQP
jgi:uncharacterized membrane protein